MNYHLIRKQISDRAAFLERELEHYGDNNERISFRLQSELDFLFQLRLILDESEVNENEI